MDIMERIEKLEQQLDKAEEGIISWARLIVSADECQIDHRINRIEDIIKLKKKIHNQLSKAWIQYKKDNVPD